MAGIEQFQKQIRPCLDCLYDTKMMEVIDVMARESEVPFKLHEQSWIICPFLLKKENAGTLRIKDFLDENKDQTTQNFTHFFQQIITLIPGK